MPQPPTKQKLSEYASAFLSGDRNITPGYLLHAALETDVLTKEKAAKILEVQVRQLSKYRSGAEIKRKTAKALANALK